MATIENPTSPLYHGTKADLHPGDLIGPGYTSNYGKRKREIDDDGRARAKPLPTKVTNLLKGNPPVIKDDLRFPLSYNLASTPAIQSIMRSISMRPLSLACGTVLLSILSLTAHASPITITETLTASGFLGSSFSNQTVTLTGIGDTSNVTLFVPGIYILNLSSATVQVGAGPVATFTGGIYAFDNQSSSATGLTQVVPPLGDIVDTVGVPGFATYALNSSITGTGSTTIDPLDLFPTSAGNFDLTSFGSNTTFTATVSPSATPEPSSLALLATGILGIAETARRKNRASQSL
jgi:hypothetical protein